MKRTLWIFMILGALLTRAIALAQSDATTLSIAYIGSGGSDLDRALYQAAVLAAEQINADEDDEGIVGPDDELYQLEVIYYEADEDDVEDAIEDALGDDVLAILGTSDNSLAEALVNSAEFTIPVIFGTPDAPTTTNVYRNAADYDNWAQAIADYVVNERHISQVATVSVDTETAQSGIDAFTNAVGEDQIAVSLTHDADTTDFDGDARTIRDSNAEAVLLWTLDEQAEGMLAALQEVGWDGLIIYAGLDETFIERVDPTLVEGVIGPMGWYATAYDAASQEFAADYAARWESTAPAHAAAYYDAVNWLGAAVAESGEDIADSAASISITGVQGSYASGDTTSLRLFRANAGLLTEVARYDENTCQNCPDIWLDDVSEDDATSEDTFNLSLMGNLDGAAEANGRHALQGAELAVREINDNGGVIGSDGTRYFFSLNSYSITTTADAATAFNEAAENGAQVILGPDYNGQIMPNLTLASQSSVPQLVSATSPEIAEGELGNYVFQARADDIALANAAANYLLDVRDVTEFATFAARTDYGLETISALQDTIADSDDGRVVLSLEHDVDSGDFAAFAQQIVDSEAQVVMVWTTQPAAASLLTALGDANWQGVFVYGYVTPEFATSLSIPDGIEVLGTVNWWNVAGDATSLDFTARYTARYGEAPAPQSAAYYDAVYLLAQGIQGVGTDSEALQSWLIEQEVFAGVQGSYHPAENANGELTSSVMLIRLAPDGIVELARYDNGTCWVNCDE